MKRNKLLAVLLALAMTLSLLPTMALADEPAEGPVVEPTEVLAEDKETITDATELIAAMKAGGDITLGASVSLAESVELSGAVTTTVDLSGHTLTIPNQKIVVKGGAKLTIKNGNIEATAEKANNATIAVETGSSVTLNDVVYNTTGAALYPNGDAAKVQVIDSQITAAVYAVATNASGPSNYYVEIDLQNSKFSGDSPVFINVPGTLKMTNCEVNASMHGVVVRGGTADIRDSVITQNYPDDNAEVMAAYFNNRNWGSGNTLNLAAMTIGNKVDGAYNYPTNVTLTNTKLITAGDNADLFPALYSWANTGDGKGVTFVSDADCEFDGDICFGDNARNTSVTFNGGSFTDLADAAKYSAADSVIYLLKDVSYLDAEANTIVDMSRKTLDLNQHTITNDNYSTHNALIFDGEDFTIQNGTFYAPGDYALWIGENGADGVTVDGITTEGGINIYNSVNVTLKNTVVDATEKTYYAVWCDEGAFATIESGSYSSGGKAVIGLAERDDDALDTPIAGLSIAGGTFTAVGSAALVLEGEKCDKPVITGGTFSSDPSDYVADGYKVVDAYRVIPATSFKVTFDANGGTCGTASAYSHELESLPTATRSGSYSFNGWYTAASGGTKVTSASEIAKDTILYAQWTYTGGSSSSGGGSSSTSTTTTTEKNPDGSTTTTTTNKTTGTVTETTKNTDGSTTTVETKKDGTVTETNKTADGTTGTVVTDKYGDVAEVQSTVSSSAAKEAAKTGEAVTLPVEVPAAASTEDAPAVEVTVPKSAGSVKVEIPVEKVTPGTVAVIVNADGTEEIVSTSVVTENGVALTLDGSATVKIIDNSKDFVDVPETNVFYNEISSLSAREIMIGKTEDTFDLYSSVTLNQIANVAGRITGAVDVKDFNAGIVWGGENGLKTGNVAATRGDVLKALYVAAGSPAVEDTAILARFSDSASISADMAAIVAWAAQNGILKGTVDGKADLGVNVTRGQACALAGRAMGVLA